MRIAWILPILALPACVPTTDGTGTTPVAAIPAYVDEPDIDFTINCPAERYQRLVGRVLKEGDIRHRGETRVIPPNTAVSMDYVQSRLNVAISAESVVTSVYCG